MQLAITPRAAALIAEAEGFDQPGQHPGGGSGVTLGVGYDLGFYSEKKFRADWGGILPEDALDRLSHAIGLTGGAARSYCARLTDIKVPRAGALHVFQTITLPDFAERAAKAFPGAEKLPEDAQGALVSLVFNRGTAMDGDRRKEMKAIRDAVSPESDSETPTKTAYPSMTIPGNAGLAKSLSPGQMVTALVTFRVSEIAIRERDGDDDDGCVDQYSGTRVELEAQSMQFDGVKIEDDGEEDGASAFAKFRQKKAMTRNSDDSGDDGAK